MTFRVLPTQTIPCFPELLRRDKNEEKNPNENTLPTHIFAYYSIRTGQSQSLAQEMPISADNKLLFVFIPFYPFHPAALGPLPIDAIGARRIECSGSGCGSCAACRQGGTGRPPLRPVGGRERGGEGLWDPGLSISEPAGRKEGLPRGSTLWGSCPAVAALARPERAGAGRGCGLRAGRHTDRQGAPQARGAAARGWEVSLGLAFVAAGGR